MKLITQLKSWLNIEPSIGCPNDCVYCHRHTDGDFDLKIPQPTVAIGALFRCLQRHPLFTPNQTHLSINGVKSDAFLPENKKRTFQFLKLLDKMGYSNMVIITTKGLIDKNDAKNLRKLKHIKPVIFVTYSEMPRMLEKISNSQRIQSLKNLKKSGGIKCILYWRPLIKGINDSFKQIEKVLTIGEKYADAFVLSGLRLTPAIKKYMEKKKVKLAKENWHPDHKIISGSTKTNIYREYLNKNCKIPLFLKSSCAVSYLEKLPDFNAHWINPEKNCSPFCPNEQKIRCKKQFSKKIPVLLKKKLINLSREEKTFFRQKYRLPIE